MPPILVLWRSGSAMSLPEEKPEEIVPKSAAAGDEEPPRILGEMGNSAPDAPLLICIAGLHGNEPAGVRGALRVLEELGPHEDLLSGRLVVLAGNRQALAEHRRFLHEDLNRLWTDDRLESLQSAPRPLQAEERELDELWKELLPRIDEAGHRPRFLIDLHTTSAAGPAFALLDDSLANRSFAMHFPLPTVLGLEEHVTGTLLDSLAEAPVTAIGIETGQHDDPIAVDQAAAALWIALEASGVIGRDLRPEPGQAARWLAQQSRGLRGIYDVRYRHALQALDGFRMNLGWVGFQPVTRDQPLGRDRNGTVKAPESGLLLMPLYQPQGDDGFFIIRQVSRFWMSVSGLLRRIGPERFLGLFPGIRHQRGEPGTFRVDRRVARWYALELFHLLGFRRQEEDGDEFVVRRRDRH